jgi:hypothetical protein
MISPGNVSSSLIRFPPGLYEQLKHHAFAEGVSTNTLIVRELARYVEQRPRAKPVDPDRIKRLIAAATANWTGDRIREAQARTYLAFLGEDSMAHPLFTQILAGLTPDQLTALANVGKSAIPNGRLLDKKFVAMWEDWAAKQPGPVPVSHMWIKGVVAFALALADER